MIMAQHQNGTRDIPHMAIGSEQAMAPSGLDLFNGAELRHLLSFKVVADMRSFSGAADALGYTQSAISQQIASLERALNVKVFERPGGAKPVTLTGAGKVLLRHATAMLDEFVSARADLDALSRGVSGTVHIGACHSVGSQLVPTLMLRASEQIPDIRLNITQSNHDVELLLLLERGELDLVFVDSDSVVGPFESVEILVDPFVMVVSATAIETTFPRPVSLQSITATTPLIGLRDCGSAARLMSLLEARHIPASFAFRCSDNGTVIALAQAGIGAALVPRLVVPRNNDAIFSLPIDPEPPPRSISGVWRSSSDRVPTTDQIVSMISQVAEELGYSGPVDDLAAPPLVS